MRNTQALEIYPPENSTMRREIKKKDGRLSLVNHAAAIIGSATKNKKISPRYGWFRPESKAGERIRKDLECYFAIEIAEDELQGMCRTIEIIELVQLKVADKMQLTVFK